MKIRGRVTGNAYEILEMHWKTAVTLEILVILEI
jgi:hypothetical protein